MFSLANLRGLGEEGVEFKSHLDGSLHRFTPESVVDVQRSLGSDIMMVLDECAPHPCDEEYAASSNALTLRWASRCTGAIRSDGPAVRTRAAAVRHRAGERVPDIRRESAAALVGMDFDGYAIGGLSVGEPAEEMYRMTEACTAVFPRSSRGT